MQNEIVQDLPASRALIAGGRLVGEWWGPDSQGIDRRPITLWRLVVDGTEIVLDRQYFNERNDEQFEYGSGGCRWQSEVLPDAAYVVGYLRSIAPRDPEGFKAAVLALAHGAE